MIFYQNMSNLHNRYKSAERKISQKNPDYMYMGHSTELVKTGGGIKKRIFSLFAYMHYAHYVYFCVHHVFVK